MGRKIQKPNPPGSNQSATRNAERAWKKEPIDPKTFSTLVSGTLRVPTTMRDQPLATRTSSELGSEPEIAAAWGTISFDHPGLRPARMFTFPEFPGLVVMKDALQPSLQRDLITACLREYTQPPNVTNLDTHYHIPPEGIWERFLKDPGSVLPVREFESGEIAQENATDTHLAGSKGHISNIKIDPPTSQRPYVKPVTVEDALMKLRWTSIGFQYYWKTKTYHLDRRVAMPELIESVTRAIIKAVEPETGYSVNKWRPEAGIVNFYHYKDSLTAHQDRSEINTEAPLVSLR